jgi:hypothetical protein
MSDDAARDLVFVGGTGRSGTHVISHLLGHHSRFAAIPIECRFHCNPKGLADVASGRATADEFLTKLRGFWWHRVRLGERATVRLRRLAGRRADDGAKVRGLHKVVDRDRFEAAAARFEASAATDPIAAGRELFFELLWPLAERERKPALVEMSCFTVASAPGLAAIFPEARFVHAVRDGRDSGSSKVSKRQKAHHPRDVEGGIEWWEGRLDLAERGVRETPEAERRIRAISLDELVSGDRERTYAELIDFLELEDEPAMRDFFEREMSADAAHSDRWREGLDPDQQARLEARYAAALERIEREGYGAAPLLRRSFERTRAGSASR